MTRTAAQRLFALVLTPLVLMGALRPSVDADAGFTGRGLNDVRLELASLKAEARSLTVHIDGP